MFSTTTDLLMQFFSIAKKIEGRIKLQKIIYILQTKGLIDFNLDYTYALYGPYSEDLQIQVDFLVSIGYLAEKQEGGAYSYELNSSFPLSIESNSDIVKVKSLINELLSKESQLLEVTSTIYYLIAYNYQGKDAIVQKIKLLKPNLQDKIPGAFELYSFLEEIPRAIAN